MKKIDIIFILDMSGSMSCIKDETIFSFNNFIDKQKKNKNDIHFTLILFNSFFYLPYENVKINKVKKLNQDTYCPSNLTSLYDTIGFCIDNFIDNLSETPKEKRSDKSLFVILTDGFENTSKFYNSTTIKNSITDLRENLNVEFIYLGANQNACFVAESIGIDSTNSLNFSTTSGGVSHAFVSIINACENYIQDDKSINLF